MTMKTFKIKCSKCGKEQLYQPRTRWLAGRKKKCIRCDQVFVVHRSAINTQIIKEVYWKNGKYQ